MPQIKVYPPNQLPDRGVSETQFKIWLEELEVYLSQEDKFRPFLAGGDYENWRSQENYPDRLQALQGKDLEGPSRTNATDADKLKERVRDLRTVLSIVGKCVSQGHYDVVVRHSTSMQSIFRNLRCDYDIQQKGIHFLNILDAKYDASKHTPIAYYNEYRTLICNNLSRTNDTIKYKKETLQSDEKMTPMVEDMVLLNVIREIDIRLPAHIRKHYTHKMSETDRLMDFKTDIMTNIDRFLQELDREEQLSSIRAGADSRLAWINQNKGNQRNPAPGRGKERKFRNQNQRFYCRLCHKSNLPKEVFTGHNIGDKQCTQLSAQDRQKLAQNNKLATIGTVFKSSDSEEDEEDINNLTKEFGYDDRDEIPISQVILDKDELNKISRISRCEEKLGYIAPVPTQILTVFREEQNKLPVHIDLDSGATLNYAREKEVRALGFTILPNSQLSTLGDGRTRLPSVGEIDVLFFRNKWTVRYRALVTKELQAGFIGGTVFLVDNKMEQDLNRKLIHIHDKKVTVQETNPFSIMPIQPLLQSSDDTTMVEPSKEENKGQTDDKNNEKAMEDRNQPDKRKTNTTLHRFKNLRVLLPGQSAEMEVSAHENDVVAVQPWENNNNPSWPDPQLCTVRGGKIQLVNKAAHPVILKKDVQYLKILPTTQPGTSEENFYTPRVPNLNNIHANHSDNTDEINIGEVKEEIKGELLKIHDAHRDVFNTDLTNGYNDFYGKHRCELNWATSERPVANKVHVPHYNHDLQGLQQELMDDLTDQGVLLVPQEHNILVQAVCPSFLQRKQRAKSKPQHLLTKDDVRLLINFGPINDKIKPIPSHVATTEDVLIKLGRWKEIIIFDLYNGYFQIKMSDKSIPWLGVQTPFGGLRVISRSGQGLLGQAEEFDEVLAKVLGEELKEGICTKIVDDIYVGGEDQRTALVNYTRILAKLKNANLKISANKTHIFPASADVLGWVWNRGGFLSPSPHRQCSLINVKQEDIKKVKDMRSWVGLYKTLHVATPNITAILEPFETATAGKDTKDQFVWNHELTQKFREAKNHVQKMKTLYLPSPEDQLVLVPDGSKMTPGIGHILYAVVDGKRLPVRFHTFKLKDTCRKWSPCEIEALALATAVEKEFDLLRESKLPIIVCPDNKPVHDAVNLINKGKFSTSARMTSFLSNINRLPINSRHISGKAKLNPFADLQSRAPSTCYSEICSIHQFVEESIDGVIDPGAKITKIDTASPFSNRIAWKKAQENNPACGFAKSLLKTGKPPPKAIGKSAGEYFNEVRFYCREATISRDGVLVAHSNPTMLSGLINRERIIIPKPLLPALLYHLHNHEDQHPTKNQQKLSFQRKFHAMELDRHIEELYKNCYKCSIVQKLPKDTIQHESKQYVEGPHTQFHADVIKRASQHILTVKDHFSSLQNAVLIESEKAEDLKNGLILLLNSMRKPDRIYVTVDNAPGFASLIIRKDEDLEMLKIILLPTDEFNKNSNAVIDKGCLELEEELTKLVPDGSKLTQSSLAKAVLQLNKKIRRRGNISAYEIHTARDLNTGENLNLDDKLLRQNQLQVRQDQNIKTEGHAEEVHVGDTVIVRNRSDKHKARDVFIVTAKEGDQVQVQKVLHPLKHGKGKFMSKTYKTDQKRVKPIHKPGKLEQKEENDDKTGKYKMNSHELQSNPNTHNVPSVRNKHPKISIQSHQWNPIDNKFFHDNDSDEEDSTKEDAKTPEVEQNPNTQDGETMLEDVRNLFYPDTHTDVDDNHREETFTTRESDASNSSYESESLEEQEIQEDYTDADIEDNGEEEEETYNTDNYSEGEENMDLNEFSSKTKNPKNLPNAHDRISFWDPLNQIKVNATVKPMTKTMQQKFPGWRNILRDDDSIESSVNLDIISRNCVAWKYCTEHASGHDDNVHEEVALQQVDGGTRTPDSLSPMRDLNNRRNDVSMDWDNYASDPSYITTQPGVPKKYNHSSTRDDFIDANAEAESSELEDETFEKLPSPPPRARAGTSVIQCNSKTCKPASMRNEHKPKANE